uniref:Tetratricopeptide repeat protein 28 n=1 Tax=Diabrotica virgifera virgifera TaxID=50390 RepID=A0A6P7GVU4_DIAVI
MSHRDFTEVEPEGTTELPAANRSLFLEKVRQSNAACQNGDFATAVALYTDALQLDPTNHILYSNRSAAKLKQGLFAQALQDAITARDLCPTWPKAYYRQGVALQCLGRHGDALAAFSQGLAQDPTSQQLLSGLVEASIKSPLRHNLEPTLEQLEVMKLDQSPFVLISVVGQELLAAGLYHSAVTVLESALRIGSCSLKLRGSVFSALSSAHWALNQLDQAIGYMQQDLAIAKSLGDTSGECRAHGNLGSAYFSQGSYKEALTAHRYQLVLAMKCKDTQAAAAALTSLGHVYTAIGDYPNALASHKQCVQLVKQMGDKLQEAREIGNVGAVYLAMGDFDSAVDCHTQHLRIARRLGNQVEEARAYSNLGSSHHYKRNFTQAIVYHEKVLYLAQAIGDKSVEARAYAGLGHASRCAGDYVQAKQWHERQLDVALATRDKIGEGRACSNLGIVYQLLGEYDAALKLHQAHLAMARNLQDRAGMGRAYGNIGNAYSAAGFYESAIKYHKQELTISKEVHDRSSEASTHGNLAVAYQALGAHDMALLHYRAHLGIARDLKDAAGEACALLNLANCLSSRSEFTEAIPYYEQYLMISQELSDVEGEAKACHFLGYAHYCIGHYKEAVRYYDQDLALAKDLQDKMNMGRAYCNLGLAHLALGQLDTSLECQKYFLAIAHMTNNLAGKFRALGNIGDVLIKLEEPEEAIKMYHRQLALARSSRDISMEAAACGALGIAHRLIKKFDKALGYHTQELTLRQEISELPGECRAHGHLGAVHMALGNYTHAVKCYQEQLERAQELQDCAVEAQAYGNLGIARLNMGHYEDAIGNFEQQLATLERLSSPTAQLDKGRAFGSLGDCYDALGDPDEAVKCHEQYLAISLKLKSSRDQERAYRGLGQSQRSLGHLQQALVCLEKRLVVSHELGNLEAKAAAYGELGQLHATLGNLEQAVSCQEQQRNIALELDDKVMESDAICGLGMVCYQMGEYSTALRYHMNELEITEQLGMPNLQSRACGNLGAVYEALGKLEDAVRYQQQHLSIASTTNDQLAKTIAYSSLGRVHQLLGNSTQAVTYLTQGLGIAESLGRRDEEAKIRNRLGLALWTNGDLEGAQKQLEITTHLLENIRRETKNSQDYKLSLFDLQSSSYQVLQRVLVCLNRHEEALLMAERGRNRAFVDLLLERQGHSDLKMKSRNSRLEEFGMNNLDHIKDIVNRQRASVLYYSIAAGFLYSWLILPTKGIVKFHFVPLTETTDNAVCEHIDPVPSGTGLLEKLVNSVRDSLGLEASPCPTIAEDHVEDTLSERTGFLRMVNRQHLLNTSNYSLSSLFSLGSVGGSVASLQGSTRSSASTQGSTRVGIRQNWKGPSCLHTLYTMLLQPFEEFLSTKVILQNLVVLQYFNISSSHTREPQGWATSDGLVALVRSLLAAGAQSVLVSLWPVPDTATKILLRAFYSALLQGTRAARALAEAMQTVQHTKHFAHPANWAGFVLIGSNVRLSSKVALMGQALCELLQYPEKCRDALRVTLHLVEKSLQRIHRGQKNAMYTTQKSIENKVGSIGGWKELLMSVGFRFEPASNGIPSSVFFPQSDLDERLTQCSASLQALLGLTSTSIHALSKLTSNADVADDIIAVIQAALSQFSSKGIEGDSIDVALHVRLWRVPGCHELFASLGFDLIDVGQDKVTLRTGKQANRRNIQFTMQALLALFDTQEAPKSLTIDSSSSLESLASIDNDFSHSDNELDVCTSSTPTVKSLPRVPPPFSRTVLPSRRLGGAFTSYVRRRGEPDGRTANPGDLKSTLDNKVRKNMALARPGGGESDAAFTPSPPVVLQSESQNMALTLAHQSRIRHLYSQNEAKNDNLRPDSSSSASSATDWDNGHATILRRQTQNQVPPIPPPRIQPLTDLPMYNNLPIGMLENSSDSELEKMEAKFFTTTLKNKISYKKPRNLPSAFDRLSVRSEVTPAQVVHPPQNPNRKPITLPSEETLPANERLLYFSPTETETETTTVTQVPQGDKDETDQDVNKNEGKSGSSSLTIHDTILATQLRHINRELTPTISEVYHERNIGLGLAPPLSKLLLNQPSQATFKTETAALEKINLAIVDDEEDPNNELKSVVCQRCKSEKCHCKLTKSHKPWLSENASALQQIRSSDLTTADILEREVKNKKSMLR